MMDINIREACEDDLAEVLLLFAQPDVDDGDGLDDDQAKALFRRMQQYPSYKLYVALSEGKILGTYSLLIMDNLPHMGCPSSVIENVAVSLDHRRQGIGRKMMEHAVDVSGGAGCYKITLSSDLKRDAAHGLYDSLGFERHGYSFRLGLNH